MKKNKRIAFCGIISALCLVFIMASAIIPVSTYALPIIAGVILVWVALEAGKKHAYLCYIAISLLSLILPADIESKVMFIIFFGYYPLLKAEIEKIKNVIFCYVIKLAAFNIIVIGYYYFTMKILDIADIASGFDGISVPVVIGMAVVANITFVLYDITITKFISLYIFKLRDKYFKRLFK